MNPFDANERHRYIVESGGNPASSADGREKEMWAGQPHQNSNSFLRYLMSKAAL